MKLPGNGLKEGDLYRARLLTVHAVHRFHNIPHAGLYTVTFNIYRSAIKSKKNEIATKYECILQQKLITQKSVY